MDNEEPSPPPSARDRPSFTKFWRRTKESISKRKGGRDSSSDGGGVTFVDSGGPSTNDGSPGASNTRDGSEDSPATKEKAQKRRQQVRRAQIQHRQRKAGYLKQLELDVAEQRELIATAEHECRALRTENELMRTALVAEDGAGPLPGCEGFSYVAPQLPSVPEAATTNEVLADLDLNTDELMMGLELDELMGGLTWQIRDSTSPTSGEGGCTGSSGWESGSHDQSPQAAAPSPARRRNSEGQPKLTTTETQQAINFILALERVCWDHFTTRELWPEPTTDPENNGHSLMASAIALNSAPSAVFERIHQVSDLLEEPHEATCPNNPNPRPAQDKPAPATDDISWSTSGLTLQTLRGLAGSINEPDVEVTPVQMWFEMAARWPVEVLLRREVLDKLKIGLKERLMCLHFGAVVEREVFERVCGDVLGRAMGDPVEA